MSITKDAFVCPTKKLICVIYVILFSQLFHVRSAMIINIIIFHG